MKNILLAIFILTLGATGYAQNKRTAKLKLNYVITSTGKTDKLAFIFVQPKSIENAQDITKIEYNPPPDTIIQTAGDSHASFLFKSLADTIHLSIVVTMEISEFDLRSVEKSNLKRMDDPSPAQFLHSEQYIETDSAIIYSNAVKLASKDQLRTLRNVSKFVLKEIKYTGYNLDRHGALFALKTKGGDCNEFSDLFVALCRANNIPARNVYGLTTEYDTTTRHAWAEAYTDEFGWVRFDPTTGQALSFDKLRNIYIQLPDNRNQPNLQNGQYYTYRYWGDPIQLKETIEITKSQPHY